MSFTTDDFHTLVRMVEDHPEWRADLRRLLLTDELLLLPEQMVQFRAQTELQFQELRGAITRLVEAQQRTEARVEALAEAQLQTETQIATLVEAGQKLVTDVGTLKGMSLEYEYRSKVFAYFSRVINRPHVLGPDELATLLSDAVDAGVLSDTQAHEISLADIVIRGKRGKGGADVYLVVEVLWGVGEQEVDRAVQRAALLAQLGTPVIPVVAGRWVTPDAARFAHESHVWQLRNGSAIPPAPAPDG